jgi:hypothetical protein
VNVETEQNEPKSEELKNLAIALSSPIGYAKEQLNLTLHPKQSAVLSDLFQHNSRVSFCCSNEVGKTSHVAAAAILYALDMLNAQCISTAGVWMQVVSQLVPSLKAHSHRFPRWKFNEASILINGVDRYVGFSTRDEGFAQGFHRREGMPLLAIIDEAAAVTDAIFDGVEDRCNPDFLLIMGSPLDPVGRFYDIETKLAKYYTHHSLNQMECLTTDGYWLDPMTIERKIAKYGSREHPFIMSNVFGQFSKRVLNALLSLGEFNACLNSPPDWHPDTVEDQHVFVDVAGGGAKNVLAHRVGNKVRIVKKWVESSEMATCGEVVAICTKLNRETGLKREQVTMDASGAGKPMADRMWEMGWPVNKFFGNAKPRFDMDYANLISEVWGSGAKKIKDCDVIVPDDEDFRSQAITRPLKRNSSGKFQIQPKEDYCADGHASPDEADAVFGAIQPSFFAGRANLLGADTFKDERGWREKGEDGQPGKYGLASESCL